MNEGRMNASNLASPVEPPARKRTMALLVPAVVVVVLLCGASFFAGTRYQKDHLPASAASSDRTGRFGGTGGFGGRMGQRPAEGSVTAVSASSISVKLSDGSAKTYAITSDTQISQDRQTAAASDIKVGDTVAVVADTSNAANAARILINPNFGGMGGPGAGDSGPMPADNGSSDGAVTN